MNKRLLFIMFAFMTMVTSAWAEDYYLWIDNTQVNTANCSDIMGDGGFCYVPSENTLYVRGGLTSDISCIWAYIENLTIVVEKDVTLRCTGSYKHAINIFAKTKITGSGKLTVISAAQAIDVDTNIALTIEDADIGLSGNAGISCLNTNTGTQKLIIRNSNLQINSTSGAIYGFGGGITLEDCHITAPDGASVSGKDIVDKNGDKALSLTIRRNTSSNIAIDKTNFPDENFRNWVRNNCDENSDGYLSNAEIEAVKKMDISNKDIDKLTGIEYFTALTSLNCEGNSLRRGLDISYNTALKQLNCSNNDLSYLDLSQNISLTDLNCSNNRLRTLDLSNNTALTKLTCADNRIKDAGMDALIKSLPTRETNDGVFRAFAPEISSEENVVTTDQMDAARAKGWSTFYWTGFSWDFGAVGRWEYTGGEPLTGVAINETNFPDPDFRFYVKYECQEDGDNWLTDEEIAAIKTMYCMNYESDPIYDLKGIEYFTELQNLACNFNQLTSLDLSQNKKLKILTCNNNLIKGAEMDKLIASLPSTGGRFEAIAPFDPTEGNEITPNQIAAANQKNWTVYCWSGTTHQSGSWQEYEGSEPPSGIAINEANFPDPIFRWYVKNGCQYDGDDFLTDEEIEELTTMYCINYESEPIYDLTGIEHFTELQNLACCFNQLTSLDVSQNKKLKVLTCNNNKIKGTEMDNLIASLPSTGGKFEVIAPFDPNEGNEITAKQMARAINKNWTVYYWSGEDPFSGDWLEYKGSFVPTAISSVSTDADSDSPSYNLQGQRVGNGFKGIVVVNGKKVLRK